MRADDAGMLARPSVRGIAGCKLVTEASASSMGWQLGVLTTSPDLSVEWLCRGSNRRRSRADVVAKLTQVVTDSGDVLGSRFDLPPRPDRAAVRLPRAPRPAPRPVQRRAGPRRVRHPAVDERRAARAPAQRAGKPAAAAAARPRPARQPDCRRPAPARGGSRRPAPWSSPSSSALPAPSRRSAPRGSSLTSAGWHRRSNRRNTTCAGASLQTRPPMVTAPARCAPKPQTAGQSTQNRSSRP